MHARTIQRLRPLLKKYLGQFEDCFVRSEPTGTIARMTLPVSPRVESSIEPLTIRPVLAEDRRELLADVSEDEGLLLT